MRLNTSTGTGRGPSSVLRPLSSHSSSMMFLKEIYEINKYIKECNMKINGRAVGAAAAEAFGVRDS